MGNVGERGMVVGEWLLGNEVEVVTLERTDFAHQLLSNGKLKAGRRASLSFGST